MTIKKANLYSFLGFFVIITILIMNISLPLEAKELVNLPDIEKNDNDLITALMGRKAIREFVPESIPLADLAAILWAGCGIKEPKVDIVTHATRTIPSAMGVYPIAVYIFAVQVEGLASGVYRYMPEEHALQEISSENVKDVLSKVINQRAVKNASVIFLLVFDQGKSSRMNEEFAYLEAGEVVQNISLMAVDRGLGGYVIGSYRQEKITEILHKENIVPVVLMAIGKPLS